VPVAGFASRSTRSSLCTSRGARVRATRLADLPVPPPPTAGACVREQCARVGEWAGVAQLVGVDDGANRVNDTVDDVEREDVGEVPATAEEEGAGLAVELDWLNGEPELADLLAEPYQ
jgi:hypothetical protein